MKIIVSCSHTSQCWPLLSFGLLWLHARPIEGPNTVAALIIMTPGVLLPPHRHKVAWEDNSIAMQICSLQGMLNLFPFINKTMAISNHTGRDPSRPASPGVKDCLTVLIFFGYELGYDDTTHPNSNRSEGAKQVYW